MTLSRYAENKDHPYAGAAIGAVAGGVLGLIGGAIYAMSQLSDADRAAMTGCNPPSCDFPTSTDPAVAAARDNLKSHMTGGEIVFLASVLGVGYLGYRIGR